MTPEKPKTRRVRIAVVISPSGDWDCAGWGFPNGNEGDEEIVARALDGLDADDHRDALVHFIEADVEVPAPRPKCRTIQGTVKP